MIDRSTKIAGEAIFALGLLFGAVDTFAQVQSAGVLDDILSRYQTASSGWLSAISGAASRLFWSLALISMVITFAFMLLRRADIGEFFAEFIRFTLFTGFFYWLLINGPTFANAIVNSLRQLGGSAAGATGLSPSGVVDIGFSIFGKVVDNTSLWSPMTSTGGIIMAAFVLAMLALVAANMVVLLIPGWILAYAGIFFLGFGGSRWTSDMAINYYKTVLGVAAALFGMTLLVGIGKGFIDTYYSQMKSATLRDLGVLMVASMLLLVLVDKVPSLVAGIITGASIGGAAGMGRFGTGSVIGAAAMAGAAAATAGAALVAGAANIAGSTQALAAAFRSASSAGREDRSGVGLVLASTLGGSDKSSISEFTGSPSTQSTVPRSGDRSSFGDISSSGWSAIQSSQAEFAARSSEDANGPASGSGSQSASVGTAGTLTGNPPTVGAPDDFGHRSVGGIALGTMGALATGMTGVVSNKAMSAIDAAKARIGDTLGGQLAAEIRNPGAAAQARRDRNAISRAQERTGIPSRLESARQARAVFAENRPTPAFGANTLAGANDNAVDMVAEIAAFRDRKAS